jgi:hypothetical protein
LLSFFSYKNKTKLAKENESLLPKPLTYQFKESRKPSSQSKTCNSETKLAKENRILANSKTAGFAVILLIILSNKN